MERNLVSVPHRVNVIREVQMAPLQELLLFVHHFGNDVGEVVRHVCPAIDRSAPVRTRVGIGILVAACLKAKTLAEKRHDMILKAIRHGAGVRA